MRNTLKRAVSAVAALATAGGMLGLAVVAAPSAAAATGPLMIVNQAAPSTTTGNNFSVLGYTTPQACDPLATRHVTKIVAAVAANPADQPGMDGWVNQNMYSPVGVGLPGPYSNYTSANNLQGWANTYGLQLYAGTWTMEFRCQNNLGTTIYDRFTGTVVFDSPTEWHAVNVAFAMPTRTTGAVNPATSTAGDNIEFMAQVIKSDSYPATSGIAEFWVDGSKVGEAALRPAGDAVLNTTAIPAGSHNLVVKYLGVTDTFAASESAPEPFVVNPGSQPAVATTTTLAVSPTSGPAFQPVTLTGQVTPAGAAGVCRFEDNGNFVGQTPVAADGSCVITTSAAGQGDHSFVVKFVPANPAAYIASESAPVTASYTAPTTVPDEQTIIVTVPNGELTIFTPYTPANPLDLGALVLRNDGSCYDASAQFNKVTVKDTRSGQLGWIASLTRADFTQVGGTGSIAADREAFVNVAPQYIAGNALQSITVTDIPAGGGAAATNPTQFASAPAGASMGSVDVLADFQLDCVPTSVAPGQYTATVVFTVA